MEPPIYALLIGAEYYFPNVDAMGNMFDSLQGCVRDINRVEEELLRGRLKVPAERILRLAASYTGPDAQAPPEPKEVWPTYDNIVRKFKQLIDMAEPGAQVYIHYSGHGGRATSKYKDIKGQGAVDETLVPIDIEDVAESRYVRDIELARLLREMVDKRLVVTLVLDSCHSGGMTRGERDVLARGVGVRGSHQIDTRERRRDEEKSLAGSRAELATAWKASKPADGAARSATPTSGWLPEPKGYVMLAACRENERAVEFPFNGSERNGALTHWMLHALQEMGPHVSWKQVHDRILGKINSQFVRQTPQVEGEVGRRVFGLEQIPPVYAVKVLQLDAAHSRVELNTGQALGAAEGAGFAIFPTGTTDFTQVNARLAVAEITKVGASKSWAEIKEGDAGLKLEGGEPAVMIDSGVAAVRGQVRLIEKDEPQSAKAARDAARRAVADAIARHGRGFLTLLGPAQKERAANYQVAINEKDEYEILDPSGNVFENIRPVLKVGEAGAAERVVARLRHLYKYNTVEQLKNADLFSPLAGKFLVEAFKAPPGAKSLSPPAAPPEPLDAPGGTPVIKSGDTVYIRIKNDSQLDLNVAVLDLDSNWSVDQLLPPDTFASDTFVLESKKELWLAPKLSLTHADYDEGRETLKALATVGPASFRFLELPPLDEQLRTLRSQGRNPAGALERLLSDFNDDLPRTRSAVLELSASAEWAVAEVTIRLLRA